MAARFWRMIRTGIAFAVFGLYSLAIFTTVVPWVKLVCRNSSERELRVQATVNRAFRHLIALMKGLGLMTLKMKGLEKLREPGLLVMANHPTLIDAVAILSRMPYAYVVTKHENQTNFFMGGTVRGAGYISNSGGKSMISICAEKLQERHSVVLFPEGTRSPRGGLGIFHRSAARVALEAVQDIHLVCVHCHPPTLMKGQPWWDVPEEPFDYFLECTHVIRIGPFVDAIAAGEPRARVARRLTNEMRECFEKSLGLTH